MNPEKLQQSSKTSSLRVVAEDTAVLRVVPNAAFPQFAEGVKAVPHNGGTDKLIWQVSTFSSTEPGANNIPTPFGSNDSRVNIVSYVDANYLYVGVAAQDSVSPWSPFDMTFYYRVLAP